MGDGEPGFEPKVSRFLSRPRICIKKIYLIVHKWRTAAAGVGLGGDIHKAWSLVQIGGDPGRKGGNVPGVDSFGKKVPEAENLSKIFWHLEVTLLVLR
jgi:hypothetical protein